MIRRRKPTEQKVRWNVKIPVRTAAIIESAYFNRVLGKPRYGTRSHLIASLLDEHIIRNGLATIDQDDYQKEPT